MNIGATIKKYRQKQDLTQEQLAEYLNVSVSAVSQWESGKTIPDLSTAISLANFFDITLDELFDRTSRDKEKEIKNYLLLSKQYANQGEVKNRLSLWREASQKYPGDFTCLEGLANSLLSTLYIDGETEEKERNAKEAIVICERILRDCNENGTRSCAIMILVYIYSNKDLSIADEDTAVKYAMMADTMYCCRDILLETAYFTEKSKDKKLGKKHTNILNYMDLLTMNLYYGKYESEEEKIEAYNASISLWKTLIYDGNFLFFHCRLQKIYMGLARSYAALQKRNETLDALKNALYHAKCFDELPNEERHYTSIFVNAATSDASEYTKNFTSTSEDIVLEYCKDSVFDFIRDDPNFIGK